MGKKLQSVSDGVAPPTWLVPSIYYNNGVTVPRRLRGLQLGVPQKPQDGGPSKRVEPLRPLLWLFLILLVPSQHPPCHIPLSSSLRPRPAPEV